MVHIRHRSPNSRWYSGSGIYRDVTLLQLPEDYLVPDSLAVKTEETEKGWSVFFSAETTGRDGVQFTCSISDAAGNINAIAEGTGVSHTPPTLTHA